MPGVSLQNDWNDIKPAGGKESLGYPTQKPLALLERIISASSNEGDLVLDPFCGCGTTVHAAQKLNRRWIGIDVTHLAIHLIQRRLKDAFPGIQFDIVGVPKDLGGARVLALQDKYEFQKWALAMIDAQPYKGGKKGGDGGVDGFLYIKPDGKKTEKVIVSVKGGQSLNPAMVKDLIVTVDQEGGKMGVFLRAWPRKPHPLAFSRRTMGNSQRFRLLPSRRFSAQATRCICPGKTRPSLPSARKRKSNPSWTCERPAFEITSPGPMAGALHRWTELAHPASVLGFRRGWSPPLWSQE